MFSIVMAFTPAHLQLHERLEQLPNCIMQVATAGLEIITVTILVTIEPHAHEAKS